MLKIQIGDTVKVTAGKDRGKDAVVENVDKEKQTVVLPGINIYKKHLKAAMSKDQKGGIYEIPRPLSFAKVALICPNCKAVTRVGFRIEGDKKSRFCKKCDRVIESKTKKENK
jgi:large subunit ribosomal protein L24